MSEEKQNYIKEATEALKQENYEVALEKAKLAIAAEPELNNGYVLQGIAYSQLGKDDEATDSFKKAIELAPDNAAAYYNFATHLYKIDNKDEALKMARTALGLKPEHSSAKELIELIHQEERESCEAISPPPMSPSGQTSAEDTYGETPHFPPISHEELWESKPKQPPTRNYGSLSFIHNLGPRWVKLGWWIAFISIALIFLGIGILMPAVFSTVPPNATPTEMQHAIKKVMEEKSTFVSVIRGVSVLVTLLALTWGILDIIYRRANLIWLLPFLLCGFLPVAWIVLPLYILLAVKKQQS